MKVFVHDHVSTSPLLAKEARNGAPSGNQKMKMFVHDHVSASLLLAKEPRNGVPSISPGQRKGRNRRNRCQ